MNGKRFFTRPAGVSCGRGATCWFRRCALAGCLLLSVALLAGCSRSKEQAVQELGRLNLKPTADDLVRSASTGDLKALGLYAEAGIDLNATASNGENALVAAAGHGRVEALRFLLDHKANPNAPAKGGQTALMAAAENDAVDALRLLLDRKADPTLQDVNGWSALLKAIYRNRASCVGVLAERDRQEVNRGLLLASLLGFNDTVKVLLDYGAEPDTRSEDRHTPLMLAASKGFRDVVKTLLDAGADPALTDTAGDNAETLAGAKGFGDVVALLRNAPPLAADRKLRGSSPAPPPASAQASSPVVPEERTAKAADGPVPPLIGPPPTTSDEDLLAGPGPPPAAGSTSTKAGGESTVATTGGRTSLRSLITVTEIHENFLPVTLTDVEGKKAHLVAEDGAHYTVGVGDQLRGLDYRVVDVEPRNVSDKDGNPVDASRVRLRQAKTGETLALVKGIPARQKGASVTLRFPQGEQTLQVGLDQDFKIPGDPEHTYRVIDIRPRQVIVRRVEDGQVWTLEKTSA